MPTIALLSMLLLGAPEAPSAPPAPNPAPDPITCATHPDFRLLDFWIGEWDVYVGEAKVGENRIAKILDGCAITEEWTAGNGGRGHSLFYYHPHEKAWKQVWVTTRALGRGGLKEKTLIERTEGGGVRFQGEMLPVDGKGYLDRTTLTPVGADEVRQLIEISTNGGASWHATFDARYRRKT